MVSFRSNFCDLSVIGCNKNIKTIYSQHSVMILTNFNYFLILIILCTERFNEYTYLCIYKFDNDIFLVKYFI